jgi:hypothetical protein
VISQGTSYFEANRKVLCIVLARAALLCDTRSYDADVLTVCRVPTCKKCIDILQVLNATVMSQNGFGSRMTLIQAT